MKKVFYVAFISLFVLLLAGCLSLEVAKEEVMNKVKASKEEREVNYGSDEKSDEAYIKESNISSYIPLDREAVYAVADLSEGDKKEVVAVYKNEDTGFDESVIILSYDDELDNWTKIYEEEILDGLLEPIGTIVKDEDREIESLVFQYTLSGTGHFSNVVVLDIIDNKVERKDLFGDENSNGLVKIIDNQIVF